MLAKIKKEIAKAISKSAKVSEKEAFESLEVPKGEFGDVASKIGFILAPKKKENPAKIAAELAGKIKVKHVEKIEAKGPYINFYFKNEFYSEALKQILKEKEKYGKGKKKKKKVMVEFPAVNPNKPWHIGHLRNALLGDSVAKLLEFDGYPVERVDYIDDLGLQVAQSLWGYLNLGEKPEGKLDQWLGKQYVEVAKKFEEDEKIAEEVREMVKELEEGDNETAKKGRFLSEGCVDAQYETAYDLSIFHDAMIFESDIIHTVFDEGLEALKKSRAIVHETSGKNKGCWVVKLSKEFEKEFGEMRDADKILIRSDGTATYTGKDVIFHLWKFGKLRKKFNYDVFEKQPNKKNVYKTSEKGKKMDFGNADKVINVIGIEQRYPQRVVQEVLKRLGHDVDLIHLAYEHVWLPDAKFSGRGGTWVGYTADELIREAGKRVMEKTKESEGADDIAGIVGIGAIKFSFLKMDAEKKITFVWDEALSMEGNSGPYVQYAYVRTNGIMKKVDEKPEIKMNEFNDEEKKLIKKLSGFSEVVEKCSRDLAVYYIADYLLDIASQFNQFYRASPVMKAEEKERKTRLAIVKATNILLKNGLDVLGIQCPEKM